jgi:hypothetical protein
VNYGRAIMLTRKASLAVTQIIYKPATSISITTAFSYLNLALCLLLLKHTASAQQVIALIFTLRAHASYVLTSQDIASFNSILNKLHVYIIGFLS